MENVTCVLEHSSNWIYKNFTTMVCENGVEQIISQSFSYIPFLIILGYIIIGTIITTKLGMYPICENGIFIMMCLVIIWPIILLVLGVGWLIFLFIDLINLIRGKKE
jgi:hypothetical protein